MGGPIVRPALVPTAAQKAAMTAAASPSGANPFATIADLGPLLNPFSIASFTDNLSAAALIGTGEWKAASAITFGVSYTNGPATGATISSAAFTVPLVLGSPFTAGTNANAIDYPATPEETITFSLAAAKSAESDTDTETVTFSNYIRYGVSSVASGYSEANVEALATAVISGAKGRTFTVTPGANEYIIYALPARLGSVAFWVGGLEGGFMPAETVSITNSAGYTENYSVFRSTNLNLGSTTVTVI